VYSCLDYPAHNAYLFYAALYYPVWLVRLYHIFYIISLAALFGGENVIEHKKAIPLQAWTGPEGSRRFRLPDFKTIGT